MFNKIYIVVLVLAMACSGNSRRKPSYVEIVISEAQSCRYDLHKGIYTVFRMGKPPVEIKFNLTEQETAKIMRMLAEVSLGADDIIRDDCSMMPKFYHKLQLKTKSSSRDVSIDLGCDDYKSFRASGLKDFLVEVIGILKAKPEIKGAPESDVIYM